MGKSGVYIEGTLTNGVMNSIAMRLTFNKNTLIPTTPFLHELIGILVVGANISGNTSTKVRTQTQIENQR